MGSLDKALTRFYLRRGVIGQVTTDTPIAIRLKAKSAAGAVTSVTVATAADIVAITANGSTETWDFATYATLGTLLDKINASAYWDARILDALRSDVSASVLVNGAIVAGTDIDGSIYYDVLVDTSTALHFSYRLAYDRSVGIGSINEHMVKLQEIKYNITVGTPAMDNFQIFEIQKSREVQIWKDLNAGGAATTVNWASGEGFISSARPGNELLIRIKDAATLNDLAANYLTVTGLRE